MLDELLGRAALKEQIVELETEIERLEDQLEREKERRVAAVRDRQDADQEVNRLEDRIADLEGQLERAETGEWAPRYRRTATLGPSRMASVLERLTEYETEPEAALTAMVDDRLPDTVREAFDSHAILVNRAAPCVVLTDDAGLVSAALDPPLAPGPFVEWDARFRLEREWFEPTGRFGFALIRSDIFAFGVYEGRERVDFEGFESDLRGQHSKGGFSQARFERRRDEQITEHIEECQRAIDRRAPERLIVVGDQGAIESVEGADAVATVDATGDPEPALGDAFQQFWMTTLYCI